MVVDCKGFYNKRLNAFALTGPSIHTAPSNTTDTTNSTTRSVYSYNGSGSNHGTTGFRNFYSTHVCNEVCCVLGLDRDLEVYKASNPTVFNKDSNTNSTGVDMGLGRGHSKGKESGSGSELVHILGGKGDAFHILNNTQYF